MMRLLTGQSQDQDQSLCFQSKAPNPDPPRGAQLSHEITKMSLVWVELNLVSVKAIVITVVTLFMSSCEPGTSPTLLLILADCGIDITVCLAERTLRGRG